MARLRLGFSSVLKLMIFAVSLNSAWICWAQVEVQQPAPKRPAPYPVTNPLFPKAKPPTPAPAAAAKSDADKFRQWRRWYEVQGTTTDQDHEDAGLMLEPDARNVYTGIYAKHLVYPQNAITLNLPTDALRGQILYAATTRPPNGSCLEVGTAYVSEPSANPHTVKTDPTLYVYDFCAPGGGNFAFGPTLDNKGILIDQQFIDKYTKANAQGQRSYEIEIFADGTSPLSVASIWYAQIYNQMTGKWETLYSDRGLAEDKRGWSIFETYFQKGHCPESLPPLGSDQISLLNSKTGLLELVTSGVPWMSLTIDQGGQQNNNCFVPDATGPASYRVLPQPPLYYSWTVESLQGQ